jgi:hypothetical protein
MTCNLAVSITKAALTPKHLRDLVTDDIATQVITTFLEGQHPEYLSQIRVRTSQYAFEITLLPKAKGPGTSFRISITSDWRITAKAIAYGYATRGDEALANQLVDEMTQLLSRTADALFARQVQSALSQLGGTFSIAPVMVEEAGQSASATLMTVNL